MLRGIFKVDFSIVIFPIILALFGLSTVFYMGDSNSIFYKQLILHIFGVFLVFTFSFIDFRFLKSGHFTFFFYIFSVFLLLLLVVLGKTVNGSQSWFRIGGISLQPVELAKLSLIFILAKYFYKRHTDIAYLPTLLYSLLYVLVIFILTIMQPDLGSALVVLGIWGMVVFVSGIPKRFLIGLAIFGMSVISFAWVFFLQEYQKERIFNFIDPTRDIRGSGYNVYQSMIAVGSGGVWGKGINFGSQSKLSYLPEYETDFIFAAFAEEWGLVGVILCIIVYLLMIFKILFMSLKLETNFETFFAVGFVAYMLIHSGVNIGMNIGLLPVTGIPLPFMSSGGTHVLVEWLMVAYLVSVSKNRKRIVGKNHGNEFLSH